MPKQYVITTPIYYPNSVPHIGTALTTIAADVIARYHRMLGEQVFFLTGTDENGLKLKEAAEKNGRNPKEFVDEISEKFRQVWEALNIRPDDFIRTTEPRHIEVVQEFFTLLQKNGYVYSGTYEGWYDVSTETFFKESDLIDGKSPEGNPVRKVKEDNYFFKLSAFGERLLEYIEANPTFLIPASRKNEVASYINQGLRDVCISRLNPGWGIPVPGDPTRVVYVWFDAVINYLSATGWPDSGNWQDKWPADVHLMAKDIFTRFHATLWPAMLMAAGMPLPKHVVGHAYLVSGGEKISKSKPNQIFPVELAEKIAAKSGASKKLSIDAVRYVLAAVTPFEADTSFSEDEFYRRYNSDLANDLGNALNRSLSMAHRFVGGTIPSGSCEPQIIAAVADAKATFETAMEGFRVDLACSAAIDLIRFLNKYIDTRAPWALAKKNDPELGAVLRSMLLALRSAEGLFRSIIPDTADAIAVQLGLPPLCSFAEIGSENSLPADVQLGSPSPMFPRIDLAAAKLLDSDVESPDRVEKKMSQTPNSVNHSVPPQDAKSEAKSEITIEDFMKVQLRVARILDAEFLEGSDKLMKLQVVIGDEKRQIVAGIRKSYTPEELVGRQIVVVANLKPTMLRGAQSQGMLLAATDEDGSAILLSPDREAPEGSSVK